MGAGRHFKLDVKNRFLMLLVYYRLYITYTLAGFLFDLNQSNICRDIHKIEPLVRKCVPIPRRMYRIDLFVIREGPKLYKFLELFNDIYNFKPEVQSTSSIVLDIFLVVLIMQEIY